jgi:transposase
MFIILFFIQAVQDFNFKLFLNLVPRGTYLNDIEKGQILAHHEHGLGMREIGRKIGRSDKVVASFLKNPEEYGTKKSGGPKKKLTPRDERRILNAASNSFKSISNIRDECGVTVSRATVGRVLQNSPNIVNQHLQSAPRLLPRHKEARLEFARENMQQDWSKVTFCNYRCPFQLSS